MIKNKEELRNAIISAVADYCYENEDGNFDVIVKVSNDGVWSDAEILEDNQDNGGDK